MKCVVYKMAQYQCINKCICYKSVHGHYENPASLAGAAPAAGEHLPLPVPLPESRYHFQQDQLGAQLDGHVDHVLGKAPVTPASPGSRRPMRNARRPGASVPLAPPRQGGVNLGVRRSQGHWKRAATEVQDRAEPPAAAGMEAWARPSVVWAAEGLRRPGYCGTSAVWV